MALSHTPTKPLVIAIVGTTASGKTALATTLATELAARFPDSFSGFDFISADSRQVYQGLEITTGAEIPATCTQKSDANFSYTFFEQQLTETTSLRWHGLGIIPPTASWSVAEFTVLAQEVIPQATAQKRLVFVIGGTGLYQQAVSSTSLQDVFIKPNLEIRAKAEKLTVSELQQWLNSISPETLTGLNQSDCLNPRRLIRHIEKIESKKNQPTTIKPTQPLGYELHTFGITQSELDILAEKILKRVRQRIELGALQEVGELDFTKLDAQARTTLGLREIKGFLESQYDLHALEQIWTLHEKQYAKRQLTWWKKQPNIQWLNAVAAKNIDGLVNQIVEMTGVT